MLTGSLETRATVLFYQLRGIVVGVSDVRCLRCGDIEITNTFDI
jgi:hypothetical protein